MIVSQVDVIHLLVNEGIGYEFGVEFWILGLFMTIID